MADSTPKLEYINASHAKPINDTLLRRFLTWLCQRTFARWYREDRGRCARITPGKILKRGAFVDLTEAVTMQYIAEKTSIPVPKVYCSFVSDGMANIVMERLPGVNLHRALRATDEPGRDRILAELKAYLDEMRALPPPPGTGVQSCIAGSLYDGRIYKDLPRFGPFDTVQEFHLWLRDGLKYGVVRNEHHGPAMNEMILRQDATSPLPVFTHGDLNPSNILVHNGHISGIIDWEFAGWYPNYWEFTSIHYLDAVSILYSEHADAVLAPFPEELKMEKTRQRYWGEY